MVHYRIRHPLMLVATLVVAGWAGRLFAQAPATRASAAPDRDGWITIAVQAVQVADDDGNRAVALDRAFVARQIDFATAAFRPARVRFEFDSRASVPELHSTLVNQMAGIEDARWGDEKRAANGEAAKFPGKLVIFFRHGPGRQPVGGSFSSWDYNFVASAGAAGVGQRYWNLAHEMAHYLGLAHPHGGPEFESLREAQDFFVKRGSREELFDGDQLSDTPPEPGIKPIYTDATTLDVTLGGHRFIIGRGNVVSYYHFPTPQQDLNATSLTPQQIARLRWFTELRRANEMRMPSNLSDSPVIEAEQLRVLKSVGKTPSVQDMNRFARGSWSGDAQLFGGGSRSAGVTLELPVPRTGKCHLRIGLTRAPDYGKVRVLLDAGPIGAAFDGYGLAVIPSGLLDLGDVMLTAGPHRLSVEVTDKNAASSGWWFGIDCVELRPLN